MPEFMFTHRFPKGFTGSPETAAAATAYFREIADVVVRRNDPAFEMRKLGDCDGATETGAYTIVTADDAEAALAIAGRWPLLQRGAGLELRQLTTGTWAQD